MDFHGMKRKNLQILCKKHGIPGNLKNAEMATRLASLFEKETVIETEISPETIKDDVVGSREAKKVKFSPENEVFEFTRSVKKCHRRNVRTCRVGPAQGEIELRRFKRSVLTNNKDEELAKNSVKKVFVDFEVEETRKCNKRNVLDIPKVEKVLRRSRRLVNNSEVELNTHEDLKVEKDQSIIKLTTDVAKPCIGGGTTDSPLCPTKDGKEERKIKKSKGSGAANSTEGELRKDNTKESSIDCKVQKIKKYGEMEVQDVEKVPRRSKRLGNIVNVPTDKRPVVDENGNAVKYDLEKSDSSQGGGLEISANELLVDGESQRGDNQLKSSSGNDSAGRKILRSSEHAAVDNTQDQAMADSSKRCSARGDERDGALVDKINKLNVNDEMQVHVRFTRNSSRQNSKKAPVVVERNLVEKKTNETLDSLVKSPRRVTRSMKRGRTVDPSMNKDTLSIQRNLTPEKYLVENGKLQPGDAGIRNLTELVGTNVEARNSSKKTKTVNQEIVKDNQQGVDEDSSSSSETKAIEHVMIAENVLDSSPRKSVHSSKKSNTQELSSDLMEEECEGKHEQDTVLMVASAVPIERSSRNKINDGLQSEVKTFSGSGRSDGYLVVETTPHPTSVPLAVSDPELELSVPTGHIAEEDIRTKEETLISTHRCELKEQSSVSKLAEAKAILENSAKYGKEFYSNIYHEKGSLEKDIQAENLHGNFSEYDTVNISAEALADISKVGFETMIMPITSMLEEQEVVKDKLQGMSEESFPSETKATEPVMVAENELDFTPKISVDISQRTNTQELSSELMEELESNHEQDTISMAATNKDKEDNASTVIAEEDIRTKEDTLISTPRSEIKENSSVSKFETEAKLETSAECEKEIFLSRDNEKGSLEKETQAANIHGNFDEYNSENISAENAAEITKVDCDTSDGNISSQTMLMLVTSSLEEQTVSEQKEAFEMMSPNKFNDDAETCSVSKGKSLLVEHNLPNMDIDPVSVEEVYMESVGHVVMAQTAKNEGTTGLTSPICKGTEYSMEKTAVSISKHNSCNEINIYEREETDLHAKVDGSTAYDKYHDNALHGDKSKDMVKNVVLLSTSINRSEEESRSRCGEDNLNLKHFDNLTEVKKKASSCEVSVDHCGKLEPPGEPKDGSLVKSEEALTGERGCKLHALELRQWSSTDFATLSPKEENISKCSEEDEFKALSQPLPTNRADSTLHESIIFTIPERNSQMREQLSENGKTRAADSATHQNYEVQSHAIVFTTPERGLFMGYTGLDEAGNKKEHKAIDIPVESDILNTTEGSLMLEASRQNEARNKGESIVVEFHDESAIATSPVRQVNVGDFKEDVGRSEENKTVEFPCESDICSIPDRHILLRNSASHGAESKRGNEALEFFEKSVVSSGMKRHQVYGHEEPELGEAGCLADKSCDKSSLLTSLERQLMYGHSLQKESGKTAKKADAEFHHESAIPNIPERQPLPEAAKTDEDAKKIEENKVVELHVDCSIITNDEKHSVFETSEKDEGAKRDNITAKSHDESDIFSTTESHSLIGDSEVDEAEKYRENKDVELLGEFTNLEGNHIIGTSGLDGTRKTRDKTAATCEERRGFSENSEQHNSGKKEGNKVEFKDESAYFTTHESCLRLGEPGKDRLDIGKSDINQYQRHYASSPIVTLKDDRVVLGSRVAVRDNTTNDSYDRTTLKVSFSHEFNAGQETAGMPKDYQTNDAVNLHATQGTLKKSRWHSPYVETVNLLDFNIDGATTIMEAEGNDSCKSNEDLRSRGCEPLKTDPDTSTTIFETIGLSVGELSSHLEVSGTCSLVSEESALSTDIQNQINDAPEELVITDNNGVDKLIEAKVTNNTREADIVQNGKNKDHEGDLLLNTSGDTSASKETCVSAGKESLNLGFNRGEDFGNTCQESGCKLPEDGATGSIAAAFALQSETRGQSTFQSNKNEKGEEMIAEETLNESSYGTCTSSQRDAMRQPVMIHTTQVKHKRHDMKENAQSSKIVKNLNVTAPRTSKRHPLQDLRKIN